MGKRLTDNQIELACTTLLTQKRRVGVREVKAHLHAQHGASGRNARVLGILKRIEREMTPLPLSGSTEGESLTELKEQLRVALERAARSEEIERHHQRFWAQRYADKADELERKYAVPQRSMVSAEKYLGLYQRAFELERRLSRYEEIKDWESIVAIPAPARG